MFFFFNDTATTEIYTLSLHDALPIWPASSSSLANASVVSGVSSAGLITTVQPAASAGAILRVAIARGKFHGVMRDRKSTRLNSSHSQISYAVFCLKKKKKQKIPYDQT